MPVGPVRVIVLSDVVSEPLELVIKPTMYVVVAGDGAVEDGDAVTVLTLVPMVYPGLLVATVWSAEVKTFIE